MSTPSGRGAQSPTEQAWTVTQHQGPARSGRARGGHQVPVGTTRAITPRLSPLPALPERIVAWASAGGHGRQRSHGRKQRAHRSLQNRKERGFAQRPQRLHEKGGKRHDVPAHHRAAAALDAYVEAGRLEEPKVALFQTVDPAARRLTGRALDRRLVLAMIKRRPAAAGLPPSTCCHTFRATGITAYLSNGGTLEHAQQIAGHASPKTTKLYDRTADTVTVDEIERIVI